MRPWTTPLAKSELCATGRSKRTDTIVCIPKVASDALIGVQDAFQQHAAPEAVMDAEEGGQHEQPSTRSLVHFTRSDTPTSCALHRSR